MSPEIRDHIFEPFFTTKEIGKGTGLGLSIVYGIVKQNHGEIIVYSELGRGTTFKIFLPRVEAAEEAPRTQHAQVAGGNETILVCEDDPKIRELVERMLVKQGYHVLIATSPLDAARIAREDGPAIDLLLTDVIMPQMNGFELAREVHEARPETRVIYMSGYTDNHMAGSLELDDDVPFIQKPFTAAALSEVVRGVLRGNGATSHGGPP
jgi:CheY-like chemotaxis protein